VHVPSTLNPGVPAPVVFVHHGLNGSADGVRKLTRFDAIANEKGFIAVFPEGAGATWNAGLGVCGLGQFVTGLSDDFGFVQAMLASLQSTNNIDRGRVFATGFSMGGYFANHIGCMRHDLVRAVAPHSGGGPPAGCAAGPLPALIIHGTADTLIWYPCGVQARDSWVAHNGCSTAVDVVPVKGGFCEYNRGCPPGGQVGLCHLDGMGHGWAGTDGTDGGGTKYENISRVIWDFFAKQ
jgi:polyhydroxybutyrate depolymerase